MAHPVREPSPSRWARVGSRNSKRDVPCPWGLLEVSRSWRRKGVLALVTCVVLMRWVAAWPPASAAPASLVTCSPAMNTLTVSPNGCDDSANLRIWTSP